MRHLSIGKFSQPEWPEKKDKTKTKKKKNNLATQGGKGTWKTRFISSKRNNCGAASVASEILNLGIKPIDKEKISTVNT